MQGRDPQLHPPAPLLEIPPASPLPRFLSLYSHSAELRKGGLQLWTYVYHFPTTTSATSAATISVCDACWTVPVEAAFGGGGALFGTALWVLHLFGYLEPPPLPVHPLQGAVRPPSSSSPLRSTLVPGGMYASRVVNAQKPSPEKQEPLDTRLSSTGALSRPNFTPRHLELDQDHGVSRGEFSSTDAGNAAPACSEELMSSYFLVVMSPIRQRSPVRVHLVWLATYVERRGTAKPIDTKPSPSRPSPLSLSQNALTGHGIRGVPAAAATAASVSLIAIVVLHSSQHEYTVTSLPPNVQDQESTFHHAATHSHDIEYERLGAGSITTPPTHIPFADVFYAYVTDVPAEYYDAGVGGWVSCGAGEGVFEEFEFSTSSPSTSAELAKRTPPPLPLSPPNPLSNERSLTSSFSRLHFDHPGESLAMTGLSRISFKVKVIEGRRES
ncbi:hypothetical protein BDQ17DRAFT_1427355 [Cyathus striatus]|nr:hypothetical protein BDQ17DRAFT_1427355 [Cyathus striatus]